MVVCNGEPQQPAHRASHIQATPKIWTDSRLSWTPTHDPGNVGAWMVDPNPGPLLAGRSPVDTLTRMGTPGWPSDREAVRFGHLG